MMTLDERRMAGRIRAGEPQAFRDLYDAYGARLLGYALRLAGSREEAEDLVQETFVAAYSGRETFQGNAKLISWLLGIATRRWRDRGRRYCPPTVSLDDRTHDGGIEQGVVNAICLAEALGRLEPPFREALLLVRSQGLTYAEAAGITGEPEGTVKWRVYKASRRAQKLLECLESSDGDCDEVQREPAKKDRSPSRR
jgi:RNA polymerase sigma-70 factor, ECF subfamily